MQYEQLEEKWDELKGQVKEKWSKITDGELNVILGKKDQLLSKIREHYGYGKDEAEKKIKSFLSECRCGSDVKTEMAKNKKVSSIKHKS